MNEKQLRKSLGLASNGTLCLIIGKLDKTEIGKAICAFVNANGGYVVCRLEEGASEDIKAEMVKMLEEKLVPHAPVFFLDSQI